MSAPTRTTISVCTDCGHRGTNPAEYHPIAFCALVKAGLDPWKVVSDAAPYLKSHDIRRPAPTSSDQAKGPQR